MKSVCVGMLAGLAIAASSVSGQNAPASPASPVKTANNIYRFRLLGVYDQESGDPVEGVEVADVLSGANSLTSKTGTVSLFFLPDGGSLVRLRKVGYEVQTLPISISPADTNPITVTLAHARTLPTVVVRDSAPKYISPSLRGFEERRRQGIGHFIDAAQLRKDEGKLLSLEILAHIPGVTLAPGRGGASYLVSARQCAMGRASGNCSTAPCYVRVFMDNVMVYDGSKSKVGTTATDLNRINTDEWAGIEFYSGGATVPVQYNSTGADCGTLLLWSRER